MDNYDLLENQFEKFVSEKELSKYVEKEERRSAPNFNKNPIDKSDIQVQNVLNATIGSSNELLNSENLSFRQIENIKKDDSQLKLLDKIICEYGYGLQIIRIFLISLVLNFITNFVVFHVSSNLLILQESFKSEINIAPHNIGIILSCVSYTLRAIGCFSLIFLIKCFSRITLIFFSLTIIFLLKFLATINFTFFTYLIFIIFGCFCAGMVDTINTDILCESLPIKFRGFFMCLVCLGSPLSQVFHFVLLNISYSDNENNFQIVLFGGCIIILLLSIIVILTFEDSARNLILREDLYKAHSQLEKFLTPPRPLTPQEKNTLYEQMHYGLNNKHDKKIDSLFTPMFLRTTLLFIGILTCFKSADDGLSAVLTLYIQKINNTDDHNFIGLEGIKINLIGTLGPIVSGILVEIKTLGRKLTLIISSLLILIFYIFFRINVNNYILWLGLITIFCNSGTSTCITFVTETYPTIFRDVSEGFFNCISAVGSLIGNLVLLNLFNFYEIAPFYFQIVNSIIAIVLVYFLKYETCQKALDIFMDNEKNFQEEYKHDKEELKRFI